MSTEKMREEFENSPRFKGMDFTMAPGHPDYYESPYANGAWDGWKASREALVIEVPELRLCCEDFGVEFVKSIEAAGVKVAQ
jgi:hypothetical protein